MVHISEAYVVLQLALVVIVIIISIWRAVQFITVETYDITQSTGKRLDRTLWRKR